MYIPEVVKYPKYLLNTELLSWKRVHSEFIKFRMRKSLWHIEGETSVEDLLGMCPYFEKEEYPKFSDHKMSLSFWEQRVLLGILALYTAKGFLGKYLHTSWYALYKACFVSEVIGSNGNTSFSRGEKSRVKSALSSIAARHVVFFTRSFTDNDGVFHFSPRAGDILSTEDLDGVVITLEISDYDIGREIPNNYYKVPSNVFTFMKSSSKYSPLFVKWLCRQDEKKKKVFIRKELLIETLGLDKAYKTNKKWAEKTLFTAYQEAKDAGILLGWKEKGEQDVFYIAKKGGGKL